MQLLVCDFADPSGSPITRESTKDLVGSAKGEEAGNGGLSKGKRQGTMLHLDLWCEEKDDFSRACREPPDTLGRWVSPEGTLGVCVMGRQEDNKRQGEMGGEE